MVTRTPTSSVRTSTRVVVPPERLRAEGSSIRSAQKLSSTPQGQDKIGKGARVKVGTKRLGEYVENIPQSAVRARLPTRKKDVVTKSKTVARTAPKKDKPKRLAEKAMNKGKGGVDTLATPADEGAERSPYRKLMQKYPVDLYPRASAGDGGSVTVDDFMSIQSSTGERVRIPAKLVDPVLFSNIGNLKTVGLEDPERATVRQEKSVRSNRTDTQGSKKSSSKYQLLDDHPEDARLRDKQRTPERTGGSRASNKERADGTGRPSQFRSGGGGGGGGGGDDSSSNGDSNVTPSTHGHRRGDLDTDNSSIVSDESGYDIRSLVTENGSRYRDMFRDDQNAKTDTMDIPHWILWTAGIRRVDVRYLIISTLGLNSLVSFTFVREEAVVRMSKTVRRAHKVNLSEVEMAMVWTAVKIVQMALLNKKEVDNESIRKLVTSDELVRVYNMNELSKSKSSTMDDVKPPTVVTLNNSSWKNWYQQIVGYFKVHPNSTKET